MPEQEEQLRLLGCDVIQGDLASRPIPADDMTRFLDACQIKPAIA